MRIKHLLGVLAPYVIPLILAGIGFEMPDDISIKVYIAYGCYITAGLVFCRAVFKDIKSYLQKRKNTKIKKESLPQRLPKCGIQDDCVFDGTLGSPGWLINRKTNEKFCYDCRGEDGSKIHLIRESLSEWFCPICKRPYESRVERMKDLFMKNRHSL